MKKTLVCFLMLSIFLSFLQPSSFANQTKHQDFSLDVEVKPGPKQTEFIINLQNTSKQKQVFMFSTSQYFEIQVIDLKTKETLYTYSTNKAFLQALQKLTLMPGEQKQWTDKWVYKQDHVPEGDVLVKVTLLAKTKNQKPIALNERTIEKKITYPSPQPMIRNVKLEKRYDGYYIEGTVSTNNGVYFSVDDGHRVFINDKKVPVKSNHFSILVPYKEIPQNVKGTLLLTIYTKKSNPPYAIELDM